MSNCTVCTAHCCCVGLWGVINHSMLFILDVTVIRHFSIPRIISYALILFLSAKTVQRQWERPGQPSELCQGESAARSVYPNSGGGVGTTPGSAPAPPVKEKLSPRGGEGVGVGIPYPFLHSSCPLLCSWQSINFFPYFLSDIEPF